MCAHVGGEINVEEAPRLADLAAGDEPGLGAGLQGVGVQAEELRGGAQVEGVHGAQILGMAFLSPARIPDQPIRRFHSTPSATTL